MAFRAKRRFTRRFGGGRSRRGRFTNQKWISFGTFIEVELTNDDPLFPSLLEAAPIFVPLVAVNDYVSAIQSPLFDPDRGETQERTRVIRSIGHVSVYPFHIVAEPGMLMMHVDRAMWFAALDAEHIADAAVASSFATNLTPFDEFNMNLEGTPPLWRKPVKKWMVDNKMVAFSNVDQGADPALFGSYKEEHQRSWDFRPGVPMMVPTQWYLVINLQAAQLIPATIVESTTFFVSVTARTLIAD